MRLAHRILGDLSGAEEVRQDVFVTILRNAPVEVPPGEFAAWIRRCTVNAAITEMRRRKRQGAALERLRNQPTKNENRRPDLDAEMKDESAALQVALSQLEPQQRAWCRCDSMRISPFAKSPNRWNCRKARSKARLQNP